MLEPQRRERRDPGRVGGLGHEADLAEHRLDDAAPVAAFPDFAAVGDLESDARVEDLVACELDGLAAELGVGGLDRRDEPFAVERLEVGDLAEEPCRVVVSGREDPCGLLTDERGVGEALRDRPSLDEDDRVDAVGDGEQLDQAVPGVDVDASGRTGIRSGLPAAMARARPAAVWPAFVSWTTIGSPRLRLRSYSCGAFEDAAGPSVLVDDRAGGVVECSRERVERPEPDATRASS